MSTIAYYFDSWQTQDWTTDEDKMVDGVEGQYASTNASGDVEYVASSTCPGTNLGTISKVELRAYGYGDGDDRIDFTPKFGGTGGDAGDHHEGMMPSTAGWGPYQEITNDTNAPSPWGWPDVQDLDCYVEFDKSGKGNTMYCGMVQIRVTYEPSGPTPGYYQLQYTSEPPTPNAWNQLKQEAGSGDYMKLFFEGD